MPLYFAVSIAACVLFSGSGIEAKTVLRLAGVSAVFRTSLFLGWIIASLPAVKSLLVPPEALFLRTLPVAEAWIVLIFGLGLGLTELPWIRARWRCCSPKALQIMAANGQA